MAVAVTVTATVTPLADAAHSVLVPLGTSHVAAYALPTRSRTYNSQSVNSLLYHHLCFSGLCSSRAIVQKRRCSRSLNQVLPLSRWYSISARRLES